PVELPTRIGILPFRNKVLLPGAIIRIQCTSPSSVKLVEEELWQREEKGLIGILPVRDAAEIMAAVTSVVTQGVDSGDKVSKNQSSESSKVDGKIQQEPLYWHTRGVAARALHLSRGVEKPSGRVTYIVVLEGLSRFSVQELNTRGTYPTARISPTDMTKSEMEQIEQDADYIALSRQFKLTATELITVLEQKQKTGGRTKVLLETVPVHKLADIFVASFEISFEEQLSMLDSVDVKVRLSKATELVDRHLQSIRVAEKITQKVEGQLSKSQKEYLLRQQMRAIKEELGDNDDEDDDVTALERKMQDAGLPPNIWKHAQRELRRLKKMQPQQPGYNSTRVYLELLADLPWQTTSEEVELDLKAAKERLDSDHYGLVKVKQRIIEYLAVRKLKPDARSPVLCFVGPPGVGKTSLASSIAAALGRKFIRISLGGVKDEADIRGHRRTYVGSMPGRLIDGLKKVAVCNPVMLLDEIDKTGSDVRGDPASALLEVRARASELNLAVAEESNLLEGRDVHIHFPAGAVPKDGPSAGVTLVTSLVSLFSRRRVRSDTAMTGEMTLRGLVLPVGGIKDKVLAAHRYGLKRVILPERNLKDLAEVPSAVLASLEILLAKRMEDVLEQAFEGGCPLKPHSKL
ncbi:hypothetical protein M8C21_013924, partial [Ambrosia artemisiifolia]